MKKRSLLLCALWALLTLAAGAAAFYLTGQVHDHVASGLQNARQQALLTPAGRMTP